MNEGSTGVLIKSSSFCGAAMSLECANDAVNRPQSHWWLIDGDHKSSRRANHITCAFENQFHALSRFLLIHIFSHSFSIHFSRRSTLTIIAETQNLHSPTQQPSIDIDLNSRAIETSFQFRSYVTIAVTALDTSSTELFEFPCTIFIIFDTLHSPCGDDDDQKLMRLLITRPWLRIQMPTLNLISTGGERAEIEN